MTSFNDQGPRLTRRRPEVDVMAFRVACGDFRDVDRKLLEKAGAALLPPEIPYAKGMFAARGLGGSMLPKIPDGCWLFFHPDVVGTRKVCLPDDTWSHGVILLVPLNPKYPTITLENDRRYQILGWYVGQAVEIERVDSIRYSDPTEE